MAKKLVVVDMLEKADLKALSEGASERECAYHDFSIWSRQLGNAEIVPMTDWRSSMPSDCAHV